MLQVDPQVAAGQYFVGPRAVDTGGGGEDNVKLQTLSTFIASR